MHNDAYNEFWAQPEYVGCGNEGVGDASAPLPPLNAEYRQKLDLLHGVHTLIPGQGFMGTYLHLNWPGGTPPTTPAALDALKQLVLHNLRIIPEELLAIAGLTGDAPQTIPGFTDADNVVKVYALLDEWNYWFNQTNHVMGPRAPKPVVMQTRQAFVQRSLDTGTDYTPFLLAGGGLLLAYFIVRK